MTGIVVHQCPRCELRFSFRTEMEHHVREDHSRPAAVEQAPAVDVDEAGEPATGPAAPPVTVPGPHARRQASQARLAGLLLAVAAVLVGAYAAVFVSLSSAAIFAGAVLILAVAYVWRLRGKARMPRR